MEYSYSYELGEMGFGSSFLSLLIGAYGIYVMWRIFEKAGKPGWATLVPVYNTVLLFQIMGFSPWLLLLVFIPILGWMALGIIFIMGYINLAKAFGKESTFAVGLIFLSIIFLSILAFDDSTYTQVK